MKQRLTLFILVLMPLISIFGQKKAKNTGFSSEFILFQDYSIQTPTNGKSFRFIPLPLACFGIGVDLPTKSNFRFETGYRFKQHYLAVTAGFLGSGQWVETTHSIPARLGFNKKLGKNDFWNRFSLNTSGGILLDIMQRSRGLPSVGGGALAVVTPSGRYTLIETFEKKDINQVKSSISLDTRIKLEWNAYKSWSLYYGIGFTKGFRKLAEGGYVSTDPTGVVSTGKFFTRGTYRYATLGIRYV
jgi:hypothetical protein